jgi:hypothetical protein
VPATLPIRFPTTLPPAERRRLEALGQRALEGEPAALAEVREVFGRHPALRSQVGDLARVTLSSWMLKAVGRDESLFLDGLAGKLERMRAQLEGGAASPLERLLIDRVLITWLQVRHAEVSYAQAAGLSREEAEHRQRRVERANRGHLRACKTLAEVQRLQAALARGAGAPLGSGHLWVRRPRRGQALGSVGVRPPSARGATPPTGRRANRSSRSLGRRTAVGRTRTSSPGRSRSSAPAADGPSGPR